MADIAGGGQQHVLRDVLLPVKIEDLAAFQPGDMLFPAADRIAQGVAGVDLFVECLEGVGFRVVIGFLDFLNDDVFFLGEFISGKVEWNTISDSRAKDSFKFFIDRLDVILGDLLAR